jgi:hypothetical protein
MAPKQKHAGLFKSKVMRVTEVDYTGRPVVGEDTAIVTNGQITTAFTANLAEGEVLEGRNGNGDVCWTEPSDPSFTGYNIEATFCNVDFALFKMLTGHDVVLNDDGTIVGIEEGSTVVLSSVTFALELWTGANSNTAPREGAEGDWGYILVPFVRGGTISDITVENAAITFGVTGMTTKKGSNWGSGPYAVDLVGGEAAPLFQPFKKTSYRRITTVEIAPPKVYEGPVPVLDVTDPALTDITATPTGLSVAFAPVPTGTDPVWYDFGDGMWDLAATGSFTYVYESAGTYLVTARRGTSVVTKSVTVA